MGALSSLATVGLNAALARQAQRRQSEAIDVERDREIAELRQRQAEEAHEQRMLLAERLAAQRARAGAAGVGGGGSSQAVLRGLIEEAEAEERFREAGTARRIDKIQGEARQARRRNLLELVGDTSRSSLRLLGSSGRRRRSLLDL